MDVFDLQAKITLDSSGFKKDLDAAARNMQTFGSTVEGIVDRIGTAFAAVFAAAATGTVALVKGAVDEYARFEQLVGGVDTLFKDSSGTLQGYADAAFQTAGLSANEYMDTATSFAASLIQALGGDTAAAVDMVDMAVTDMADNANKMGTDIGSIQHAYQGFAKQNYTMLDNLKLGYGGTKSEMARLINDTGILGDTIVEVSTMTKQGNFDSVVSFDVVVDAIHAVQENMGITGTTAQEAAQTIEGSVASMKAAWSNWLVGLGDENADLSGLTDSLIGSFTTVVDNVLPVVDRIGESLTQVFSDLTGIDLSPVTDTLSAAFQGISDTITGIDFSGALSGIGEAFSGIGQMIASAFEGIDIGGYVQNILDMVSSLASGIGEMFSQIDLSGLAQVFSEAQTAVSEAWQGIIEAINFDAIGDAVNSGIEMITGAVQSIQEAFQTDGIAGAAQALFDSIVQAFQDVGPKVADAGASLLDGIVEAVTAVGQYIYEAMPEIVQGLVDSIGGFFESFTGYVQALWDWMQPFVTFLTATFGDGLRIAFEQIGIIIETLITSLSAGFEFLSAQFDLVTSVMQGDFEGAAEAVKAAWNSVLDFFGSIANGIMDIFGSLASYMASVGANMWEGLKSGFSGALDWVKNTAGSIVDGFKNAFDINSPSRVFAEFGKFMAQGLEVGWDSEMDSLRRTMTDGLVMHGKVDFANSSIGRASAATVNGMISGGQAFGGAYTINLVVDGRTLANVVFDPLNGLIKQKGVTLGA